MRQTFLAALHADPERYLMEYTRQFGNVLNADSAATLFDAYNADRAAHREAVHPAATWIRDELFRRILEQEAPPGRNRIVFTAGGNASGKSTAVQFSGSAESALAVFDSTFSNPDHARRLVAQVLAAEKRVTILHVSRPLPETLRAMLERGESEGRLVTISQMIHSARGAVATARALWDEFRDDSRFRFTFVANSSDGTRQGSIESIAVQDYTEIRKVLDEILDAEHRTGRIDEATWRRVRGPGIAG